jgi:hypothetical protein
MSFTSEKLIYERSFIDDKFGRREGKLTFVIAYVEVAVLAKLSDISYKIYLSTSVMQVCNYIGIYNGLFFFFKVAEKLF